jgi:hypothetical protein
MSDPKDLQDSLQKIAMQMAHLTQESVTDAVMLLKILRFLEGLHHNIRENYFQPSLPNQRHDLYALLREIEAEGGWPYIPRMQLREFLKTEPLSRPDEGESS